MKLAKKAICLILFIGCLTFPTNALASTDAQPFASNKTLPIGSFFGNLFSLFKKGDSHEGNYGGESKDDDWRNHDKDDWRDCDKNRGHDWWEQDDDCWGNDDGHTDSNKIWKKFYTW